MNELSMKDTKKTLLTEYNRALEKIKALEAQKFDPSTLKAKERTADAIDALDVYDWDVGPQFDELQKRVTTALRGMRENLETKKTEIEQIDEAKTALEAELEGLYGISAKAESFAALIEAQSERREKFEAELAAKRQELDQELEDQEVAIVAQHETLKRTHERDREAWEYSFAREQQRRTDKVNDDLQRKVAEHNKLIEADYKALEERKEAVAKQEANLEALQLCVDNIPTEIEAAVADAKKRLSQSHGIEISALKRSHEADLSILRHEATTLTDANVQLKTQVSSLETKLEHAYSQIQGVATQALEAQGHARTTAEVQRAVQSSATSGKR